MVGQTNGAEPPARRVSWFVAGVASLAALGGLLFGYDTGVVSGALLFLTPQFHLSTAQQEWVVSALLVGTIIGAALAGPLVDRFGRRPALLACALNYLLAALCLAASLSFPWLIVTRLWLGLAVGAASMIVPLYLSEMAPPHARGGIVTLNQLAITVGILVAYVVDFAFAHAGGGGWRWMFGLGAIPGLVMFVGVLRLPETPRWLLRAGRWNEARRVVARTRPAGTVDTELGEIQEVLGHEKGWRELLRPWLLPALVVGVGLGILQQITGINTIIYYAPVTFQSVGLDPATAIGATASVGAVNVATTVAAIFALDRIGRRPLLLAGVAGMALSLTVLGLGRVLPGLQPANTAWVTLGGILGFVLFFAFSLGPGFWLIQAEIFPLDVRGPAMSVATLVQWGANLLVASTFLTMQNTITPQGGFWLLAFVCLCALAFIYTFVPETRGRSLEFIERALRHSPSRNLREAVRAREREEQRVPTGAGER